MSPQATPSELPPDLARKHFTRCAFWDWRSADEIDVYNENGLVTASLDRWRTLVFESAESGRTVQAFLDWLRQTFPIPLPDDIDEIVVASLRYLADDLRAITLTDAPAYLPYYFDLPKSRQKPEESRRAMLEDGLIKED